MRSRPRVARGDQLGLTTARGQVSALGASSAQSTRDGTSETVLQVLGVAIFHPTRIVVLDERKCVTTLQRARPWSDRVLVDGRAGEKRRNDDIVQTRILDALSRVPSH